jgi:DMSO/TMAO reductase YedYZ molybdopterin-dependent catalytic subunit
VIVASVVTRASVKPVDAIPTLLGTAAGLLVLRLLISRLWRFNSFPDVPAGVAAKEPERPATTRRAFFTATGLTVAAAGIAAAGGRLLSAARSNVAQARESLRLPTPVKAAPAVPAGVQSVASGVTPWLTPNADFYRIDTALSVPEINAAEWELRVHGLVEEEVRLTFQDLLDADLIESHVTLTCVSNPVGGNLAGNAKWLGLPIREVLKRARPKDGADMVLSTSIDGFSASTPLEVLQDDRDAMLAIGMNGEPLPLEHGYPVRMVVPGLYGFVSATKWVVDLEVTRFADSKAYWTQRGWSERGPIKTMARVEVPASFAVVKAGQVAIGGTAWAQTRGITKVEVQIDGGDWSEAVLSDEASVVTWRQWSFTWDATPGPHYIKARATDGTGELQTDQRADPVPDGASGWQSVMVTVE